MDYKIGDKIKIKSLNWYNQNKDDNGDIVCENRGIFVPPMSKYCGKEATITSILTAHAYYLDIDNGTWIWNEDMFKETNLRAN